MTIKRQIKLDEWLRSATPEERSKVASDAETTVEYLYQIAGGHRKASGNLAKRLELATVKTGRKVSRKTLRPDFFE